MSYADKNGKSRKPAKRPATRNGKVAFGDYVFIRLELTAEDRERFGGSDYAQGAPAGYLGSLLDDGCKVSFSVDPNGGGVLCSASQSKAAHPNAGCILTGRAGSAETALAVLAYKDMELCPDGLWKQGEHEHGGREPEIG